MTLQQLSSKKYPDKGTGLQRIAYEDGVNDVLEVLRKSGRFNKEDYVRIVDELHENRTKELMENKYLRLSLGIISIVVSVFIGVWSLASYWDIFLIKEANPVNLALLLTGTVAIAIFFIFLVISAYFYFFDN